MLLDEGKADELRRAGGHERDRRRRLPGMVVEALGTFFLVWAIIGVAVNPRAAKDWAAFAIGARARHGRDGARAAHRRGLQPGAQLRPGARVGRVRRADDFLLVYVVGPCSARSSPASSTSTSSIAPGKRGAGGASSRSASRPGDERDDRGTGEEVGEDRRVEERRDVRRAVHEVERGDQPSQRVDQQRHVRVARAALRRTACSHTARWP